MHRVQLHYTLSRDAGDALIRNPLPEMLEAVAQQGSISAAARALGLSYRHVWGSLKKWRTHFLVTVFSLLRSSAIKRFLSCPSQDHGH